MKKLTGFCVLTLAWAQCWPQSFVNPSVEAWALPGICETNTPPDGWTDYSNVGIGPDEGNLTICPSTIPPNAANGNTYARCLAGNPNTGEGMYQNVSGFTPGASYMVSYRFCGSNLWGGSGDCVWHLFIDDVDVNQSAVFSSGSPVWQTNNYTFTATMITHKIGVRAYTPSFNGGGSAAIDDFTISESEPTGILNDVAADVFVFPNPAQKEIVVKSSEFKDRIEIEIYNLVGEKIFIQPKTSNFKSQTVDISQLPSGIYFAEIFFNNGSTKRVKFIRE